MKIDELKRLRERASEEMKRNSEAVRFEIRVAMGTSGIAAGSRDVLEAFREQTAARGLTDVAVAQTGERGWASCEPVVEVRERGKDPVFYSCVTRDKVRRIVESHLIGGTPVAEYRIHPAG